MLSRRTLFAVAALLVATSAPLPGRAQDPAAKVLAPTGTLRIGV